MVVGSCNNSPPERLKEGSDCCLLQNVKYFFPFLVILKCIDAPCTEEGTLLKFIVIPISVHIGSGIIYREETD